MVFDADFTNSHAGQTSENPLLQYLKHQNPDVVARVARSSSPEIKEIISRKVEGLVGVLPGEEFNIQITTDRENLAGLLTSAMMTGYFLRQMEERMYLDENLAKTNSIDPNSPTD